MSGMSPDRTPPDRTPPDRTPLARPPLLGRLLAALVVGPDAEVLRGDLEEAFHARVAREGDTPRVRASHVADALVSAARWWLTRPARRPAPRDDALDPGRGGIMQSVLTELRQIWRGLLRRPGFVAVVVLTLGLGIGATTTLYGVVDAMLLRPLPYPDADRLVVVGELAPPETRGEGDDREGLPRLSLLSMPDAAALAARASTVTRIAALERRTWTVPDLGDGPELIDVANATPSLFAMLGVQPLLGRLPQGGDYAARGEDAWGAMITWASWQRRFGGDPHVVGRRIGTPGAVHMTVVGVLPRDFRQPAALVGTDVEFWLYLDPADRRYADRNRRGLRVLAQLAPGVTLARARADLAAAQAQLARDDPAAAALPDGTPRRIGANALRDETVGGAGRPVLVFLGAAALLLLLAGTNAGNLLLVRGLERERELAVRQSLGAARARLGAGLIVESVSLALAGGALGLALAALGVAAFRRFGPAGLPRIDEVAVSPRVAAAAALLSIVVGVAIGIVPALRSGGGDLLAALGTAGRGGGATLRGRRLRTALATTQLALALVLGIGASLLFRSFLQLRGESLGFAPARLVAFTVAMKSPRPWEAWDQVLAAVRAVPGVRGAEAASSLPLQPPVTRLRVEPGGAGGQRPGEGVAAYLVTPGYFATAGIPVLRGRPFDASDRPDSRPVAIVNRTLARALFGDRDPVGARLRLPDEAREVDVVGVVGDVVQARVEDGMGPAIYTPYTQMMFSPSVLVASDRAAASLAPDLRRALAAAGVRAPLLDVASMESRIARSRATPRFQLLLIGAFAGTALALSAVGLYGMLAFVVRSRARELGIRIAVGAGRRAIYRLVLRQGLAVLGGGVAFGLLGAAAVTRLLRGFLYRVGPMDPTAVLVAIAVIAAAVLLAALRPARRAAGIDPMTSIRAEG